MTKRRSDGDGAIYPAHKTDCPERANRINPKCGCRWRGDITLGWRTTPAGKKVRLRKKFSARSKAGAAAALRQFHEDRDRQTLPIEGKAPTVEQWVNHCLANLMPTTVLRDGVKATTLEKYHGVASSYIIPLLGHLRLDRLTADDIEIAWTFLAENGNPLLGERAKPLSSTTIHLAHSLLSRCLKLAVHKKRVAVNVASAAYMDAPRLATHEVQPLSDAEWHKILTSAPQVPNSARWTVALVLGLRQTEALGLRWKEDVNLDAGTLRVQQIIFRLNGKGLCFGTPKTENAKRTIKMPPSLVAELRAHKAAQNEARLAAGDHWFDSGLVFTQANGKPIDPREDSNHWHALLTIAEVAQTNLHVARHTAATIMLAQEIDKRLVMNSLGWSSSAIADKYQHAVTEAQEAAAMKLEAAVWGAGG